MVKEHENTKLASLINKYISEVSEFFELPKMNVKVHLVLTRKEFDEIEGSKTADWVVGLTKNDTIYIFEPSKFEKYTSHLKSDFGPVLKHELSHFYYKRLKPNGYPNWLDEGVACYLDGQDKYASPKEITIGILKSYYDHTDEKIYGIGRSMVAKIIEKFGKDRLFELIGIESPDDLYHELRSMFKGLS